MNFNDFFESCNTENISSEFDFNENKRLLIENLDFLRNLTQNENGIEQLTLYKKWRELRDENNKSHIKMFAKGIEESLWKPSDINDEKTTVEEINNLNPLVIEPSSSEKWTVARILIHSAEYSSNPGRLMKFFVIDEPTKKLLGIISIGSDITSLGDRDNFLGWKKEDKFENNKLQHSAIGTTIAPTQPLGYNFLGGKLIAAMCTTSFVRNLWKQSYNQTLVGMTTTSLYGPYSQYTNLPWWKALGHSKGLISLLPDFEIYKVWSDYIKEKYPKEFEEAQRKTGPKQNVLKLIYKETGIPNNKYNSGIERGVYYSLFYENGKEFMQSKIDENDLKIKTKFHRDVEYILEWWKPKAINRYKTLKNDGRIKPENLFYLPLTKIKTWEEASSLYLNGLNIGKKLNNNGLDNFPKKC
jgi:hypothetical protein